MGQTYQTIVKSRPDYPLLKKMMPADLAFESSKFSIPNLRDFIRDINDSDTKCLDKGRFCWTNLTNSTHMQSSFCLRCGQYDEGYLYPGYSSKVVCQCSEGTLEDDFGNVLMHLMATTQNN